MKWDSLAGTSFREYPLRIRQICMRCNPPFWSMEGTALNLRLVKNCTAPLLRRFEWQVKVV